VVRTPESSMLFAEFFFHRSSLDESTYEAARRLVEILETKHDNQ
jgi:hypothetical protein